MKVLVAAAECAPIAQVGGMAEAVAGLAKQLSSDGVDVELVLPDYNGIELKDETTRKLLLPEWARPGTVRTGMFDGLGEVSLVRVPQIERPHPYVDTNGSAFQDNDYRFLAFSAAVAALINQTVPDVAHLNDWHTAATLGFLVESPPTVLAIHNLAFQGITNAGWMDQFLTKPHYFAWHGKTSPLLGGIRLADRVVTVSPNYAQEVLEPQNGMGLHAHLADLGDRLVGITNGIDTDVWNPKTDQHLDQTYSYSNRANKNINRRRLLSRFGLANNDQVPVIGVVSRLFTQKGIDLLVDTIPFLSRVPCQLAVLGSGEADIANQLTSLAAAHPKTMAFREAYDIELAHQIFGGADFLVMPSRFEPCGLAQMQAMRYGTIPIVTTVGGLADTVTDYDDHPETGTGFVARSVDAISILDAMYRGVRAWSDAGRRADLQQRMMNTDWSWAQPAQKYRALYAQITDDKTPVGPVSSPLEASDSTPSATTKARTRAPKRSKKRKAAPRKKAKPRSRKT